MTNLGRRVLTVVVALPGLLFLTMGLRWLVDPAGVAPELGMTLDVGIGLSTQIGDLSAFFLVAGLSILIALVTGQRTWYYPPAMLLLLAASGRLVAWVVHDAGLATQLIVFETVVGLLLLGASRVLPKEPHT